MAGNGSKDGTEDAVDRGTFLALVAMGLAVFVLANDFTAMSVALTRIERDLNSDVATVQWVINAYALVFGVLIVTGGKLADMFGRRRIFFIGSVIFAFFSVLGGFATDAIWLIAARALMGIGGAMMWPAILGMTYAALPPRKAGLAGGMILGVAGIGNAFGPLLGGILTDSLGWRWILFLNLPIAVIAGVVTWRNVHQRSERLAERLDYAGVTTLSISLVALLVALDEATAWGFSNYRILALFGVFAALLAAFLFIERRAGARALLPGTLLRNREFTAACVSILLLSSTFFACLLYLPEFMQKILGYTALEAGLGLLPMMAVFGLVSFVAGALYERLGSKLITTVGAACMTAGVFLFSLLSPHAGFGSIVVGMVLLGIGIGLFISSATTAGVTALDPSQSSLAGGIIYLFQIAGGSVGLGLVTAIFISTATANVHAADVTNQLTNVQEQALLGALAGTGSAHQVMVQFPGEADKLDLMARTAFSAGMQASFRVVAALGGLGFLVALLFVGGRLRKPAGEGRIFRQPPARYHHRAWHWRRIDDKDPATGAPAAFRAGNSVD